MHSVYRNTVIALVELTSGHAELLVSAIVLEFDSHELRVESCTTCLRHTTNLLATHLQSASEQ